MVLRAEICRIECRNAAIRRIVRARDATYDPCVGHVSADFVLLRQRIVEQLLSFSGVGSDATATPQQESVTPVEPVRRCGKLRGTRVGGGGAQRYFFGKQLKGRTWKSKEEQKAIFKDIATQFNKIKHQGGPEWTKLIRDGRKAAVSYRSAGPQPRTSGKRKTPFCATAKKKARLMARHIQTLDELGCMHAEKATIDVQAKDIFVLRKYI